MQRFEKVGKQREVVRGERRTVGILRDTHSLISFHHKVIDEFDDIDGRIRKYDLEKRFKHFEVRIERDLRVGGRAIFREDINQVKAKGTRPERRLLRVLRLILIAILGYCCFVCRPNPSQNALFQGAKQS